MRLTRSELVAIKLALADRLECMYGEDEKTLMRFNTAMDKVCDRIREIDTAAHRQAISRLAQVSA